MYLLFLYAYASNKAAVLDGYSRHHVKSPVQNIRTEQVNRSKRLPTASHTMLLVQARHDTQTCPNENEKGICISCRCTVLQLVIKVAKWRWKLLGGLGRSCSQSNTSAADDVSSSVIGHRELSLKEDNEYMDPHVHTYTNKIEIRSPWRATKTLWIYTVNRNSKG